MQPPHNAPVTHQRDAPTQRVGRDATREEMRCDYSAIRRAFSATRRRDATRLGRAHAARDAPQAITTVVRSDALIDSDVAVTTRPRNDATTQRRNDAATQRRNDATTQRRNDAATQRRSEATTQRGNDAATQRRSDAATQRRSDAATQRRSEATTQQRNDATTQRRTDASTQQCNDAPTDAPYDNEPSWTRASGHTYSWRRARSVPRGPPTTLQCQQATVVVTIQTSRATNDGVRLSRADRQLRCDGLMYQRIKAPTKQGSNAPTHHHSHAPTQPRNDTATNRPPATMHRRTQRWCQ
jgi:flagellar biosynthesis GTPase FlhF